MQVRILLASDSYAIYPRLFWNRDGVISAAGLQTERSKLNDTLSPTLAMIAGGVVSLGRADSYAGRVIP